MTPPLLDPSSFVPPQWKGAAGIVGHLSGLNGLNRVARQIDGSLCGIDWVRRALEELEITCEAGRGDLSAIPKTGAVILAANHPFGMLDGLAALSAAAEIRSDVKVLANAVLEPVSPLRGHFILVDVLSRRTRRNVKALSEAIAWLESGGMLITFPAGEVSSWNWRHNAVEDPEWNPAVARLAAITGAAVVPAWFEGANSVPFQILGLMHPALRTWRLPAELLNKRGARVRLRIGRPVTAAELAAIETPEEQANYLRVRASLLRHRTSQPPIAPAAICITQAIPPGVMQTEIDRLEPRQLLDRAGSLCVYQARARQIPAILNEIGRLREISFRHAGEGTGEPVDLDTFDASYTHLFLWNRDRREVAGAYRLARTSEVLPREGIGGLYTSRLFRYRPEFFQRLGPAIELGRSFIRLEYQKEYSTLLLLWKGIAKYTARHAECAILFGAVSVSGAYHPISRAMIAEAMRRMGGREDLRQLVRPRAPFAPASAEIRQLGRTLGTLDQLTSAIRELEPDGKGLPVLLRQYLKLGGVILDFSVDRKFSNTLDGLVLVDLRKSDKALLSRLMGAEAWAGFSRLHSDVTTAR